jgi:ethanolamine utilization protein EutA
VSEKLRSVGLDVGTTTTQLIVSELTVQNRASGFAVPEMEITDRTILYRSQIHFTPLLDENRVDGEGVRKIVAAEYEKAGIDRRSVDTGAIIITGETSRKENARAVLEAVSAFAGDFVVATAGPDLESVLAAKGAGAVDYSERTGKTVLHMDIGGGTSNLALIENGRIVGTGCLNVGGRLMKFDATGAINYVSPVLQGLTTLKAGDIPTTAQLEEVAQLLVQVLEMAAGLREETVLLGKLTTDEAAGASPRPAAETVISFSGGVADCIESTHPPQSFGDMGPILGQAIRSSRLCQGEFMLGTETIRATVIGAGCHSAQLSGSTVFHRGVALPVKNLPVAVLDAKEQEDPLVIAQRLAAQDAETVVLAMPGYAVPSYDRVTALAEAIIQGTKGRPLYVCLEADMAKALGHSLCLRLPTNTPCLCIDRVRLTEESYLDIGAPVGPALPVVIKTLVLPKRA